MTLLLTIVTCNSLISFVTLRLVKYMFYCLLGVSPRIPFIILICLMAQPKNLSFINLHLLIDDSYSELVKVVCAYLLNFGA